MKIQWINRPVLCSLLALLAAGAGTARAQITQSSDEEEVAYQDGFFFVPSLSVFRVRDDNVFFAFDDGDFTGNDREKVSDDVTRLAPALEIGYGSDRLNWETFVSVESEDYSEQEILDSSDARKLAQFAVEYLPTRLMALSLNAQYTKTETPGELNLITGFEPGRFEAERTAIQPMITYQVSPDVTTRVQMDLSSNRLVTGVDGDTQDFLAEWEQTLSRQNTVVYSYGYRNYDFSDGASEYSHTPTIGWRHQFRANTRVELAAGPRITDASTEPYLNLFLLHEYDGGLFTFGYELGETYLIGETGRLEAETVRLGISQEVGQNLVLSFNPSYGKVEREVTETESLHLAFNATYRVNDALSLFATYDSTDQQDALPLRDSREFSRNVVFVGFTLRYPRPFARNTEE